MEDNKQLFDSVQHLVESWCDRRCLRALRTVLGGYPLVSPLGDGWGALLIALQDVRAYAKDGLTAEEFENPRKVHSSARSCPYTGRHCESEVRLRIGSC
jgi:hypothetical protein